MENVRDIMLLFKWQGTPSGTRYCTANKIGSGLALAETQLSHQLVAYKTLNKFLNIFSSQFAPV